MSEVQYKYNGYGLWTRANIFMFRMGDAIAYLILYILIPVIVSFVSLMGDNMEVTNTVYCYVTILVSVSNSIYDACNRIDPVINKRRKKYKTIKLLIMIGSCGIVAIYCTVVIFGFLVNQRSLRNDAWLLAFFINAAIALMDIFSCILWRLFKRASV